MPRFPEPARAVPGRAIPPAWMALERWVDGLPPIAFSGRDVRVAEFPDETLVHFDSRAEPWRWPFKVSVSGTRATIRPGLVNLVMPRILPLPGESEDELGLYLDGTNTAGEDTGRRPSLELLGQAEGGPGPDGRSFVCLVVQADPVSGDLVMEREEGRVFAATVEPRPELPAGFERGGGMPETLNSAGASIGVWPLAIVYWAADGRTIRRTFQVAHHNIQYRYQTAEAGPGRHWFFGAS